ncbi:MAG: hypothetical protein KF716_28280 [Anaerolineae bacterium]|nr:hypothetical protein [Anaerolineae bacterium]
MSSLLHRPPFLNYAFIIGLLISLIMQGQGGIVFAVDTTIQVVPDQSFYRPGEVVRLDVKITNGARIEAQVLYLNTPLTTLTAVPANGHAELTWMPPAEAPRGYGLIVNVLDEGGRVLATQTSAFDVLKHWMDAPRYGFFSDFTPARDNDAATTDWLLRHHINGLQFYDWQYRWEDLLPDSDIFHDGLGRPQSMATVRHLIDLVHKLNVAAMPYTAIYGASWAYANQHPAWQLYSASKQPFEFGDHLIGIMDATPGSPWNQHLMGEFADVLDNTAFDGIHVDQYGSPKRGFDVNGNPVDYAKVMPLFADQTAALVDQKRGDEGVALFNCVGNWPIEAIAPSQVDAAYIEVWPPYNDYLDLNRIITNAQKIGGNKPVILAAYISPARHINWQLSNAVIYASGGYHIETGEPGSMLADPYFPKFGQISEDQQAVFGRYYDFLVRYENVLSIKTMAGTAERRGQVDLGTLRTTGLYAKDHVVPIIRTGADFETISLINFVGIDVSHWNGETSVPPTPQTDIRVTLPVSRAVKQVWVASPDDPATMNATALPFSVDDGTLKFTLPTLAYWNMIVVEYTS